MNLLPKQEQDELRSLVYKLLYLSNRIRPDLSPIINFLCTRCEKYTIEDKFKVNRILKYLNHTKHYSLIFNKSKSSDIHVYADASHSIHQDAKGHSGLIITYNHNLILFKSRKQKITTLSSTESELVCLSDSISYIISIMNIFKELEININTKIIFQDNLSTIRMIHNEQPTTQRTKHINSRYFTVRERIEELGMKIEHLETKSMIADLLTKPLFGKLFIKFRNQLLNIKE